MDRPLGYRILRFGLKFATRAANDVVDRVIARDPADDAATPARRGLLRRAPKAPVEVVFEGRGAGTVEHGTTILEAARLLDVDISHYCGGNCSCGTCRVKVVSGTEHLSKRQSMESMALGQTSADRGYRLACQTRLLGPATLRIPDYV